MNFGMLSTRNNLPASELLLLKTVGVGGWGGADLGGGLTCEDCCRRGGW